MPHWLIKAAVQKAVSLLPGGVQVNCFLQEHVSRSTATLANHFFEAKLRQAHRHIQEYCEATGRADPPERVVELGTGWHPIVPIAMYLAGSSQIWTVDRADMLRRGHIEQVLRKVVDYHRSGTLISFFPMARDDRLAAMESASDALASGLSPREAMKRLNIDYITGDARRLPLPSASADLVFSNLVIGFIPVDVLTAVLVECARVIKASGAMCHFIDMSDLYALADHRITPYNFLRFSGRAWRLIGNSVQYLNRLRITDYRRLHEQSGFRIVREDLNHGSLEKLATVPLAPEFRQYAPEDLAVLSGWIVSRPASQLSCSD